MTHPYNPDVEIPSPGIYYMSVWHDGEGHIIGPHPVVIHADGSADTLGVRWTKTWTEAMACHGRLHTTPEASIAFETPEHVKEARWDEIERSLLAV